MDKGYRVNLEIEPSLKINMRQDVYTQMCRLLDLNFMYTDSLDSSFVFRNEEEYFRSQEKLIKSKTSLHT